MKHELDLSEASPAGCDQRSTHFTFQHAVFKFPDARFVISNDGTPSLVMRLGDMEVTMSIQTLGSEFNFKGTADADLLLQVIDGLHFVKTIRPGDSIPGEILDGTASWTIEDRHHEIARGRLTLQISTWLSGDERVFSDQEALSQLAEDPATKARVQASFAEIAERLGLGPNGKEEVINRIEIVARELAYIEALRERFGVIGQIRARVADFRACYKRDKTMTEEIQRLDILMRRPFDEIGMIFDQIDGQCGEILGLLRNITSQIAFIRKGRDDIHERLMLWDEIALKWIGPTIERSIPNENLLRELYRFLARNFNLQKIWQLTSTSQEKRV